MNLYSCIVSILLSLYISAANAQDANNVFKINAPKAGDTITSGRSSSSDIVEVPIEWTVPAAIADRPVMITLVQGANLSSLSRLEQINSSVPNTGAYTWRGDAFNSALVYAYGYGAPSGCNYSIELKVWTDVVYSGFFTFINPDDGGLNTTAQCPEGDDAVGPRERTYTTDGQSKDTSSGSEETSSTSTSTDPNSSGTSSSSGATGSNTNSSSGGGGVGGGGGSGGVSTTTLAVAVAVPVVVLLIAFGLVIWLGIRRGWFVKKGQNAHDGSTAEKLQSNAQYSDGGKPVGGDGEVRELHANHMPYQLDYSPVHELGGKEDGVGRS